MSDGREQILTEIQELIHIEAQRMLETFKTQHQCIVKIGTEVPPQTDSQNQAEVESTETIFRTEGDELFSPRPSGEFSMRKNSEHHNMSCLCSK